MVIINEAFCKTACLNNARRVQGSLEVPDIELNERKPSNIIWGRYLCKIIKKYSRIPIS